LTAISFENCGHRDLANDARALETSTRVVDGPDIRVAPLHVDAIEVCSKLKSSHIKPQTQLQDFLSACTSGQAHSHWRGEQ
jgi:hypothetical protein